MAVYDGNTKQKATAAGDPITQLVYSPPDYATPAPAAPPAYSQPAPRMAPQVQQPQQQSLQMPGYQAPQVYDPAMTAMSIANPDATGGGGFQRSSTPGPGARDLPMRDRGGDAAPAPPAGGQTGQSAGDFAAGIYEADPALQAYMAQMTAGLGKSQAQALADRRRLLMQLGDPQLARQILGEADPTLSAISDDPDSSTSLLARLARSYRDESRQADEAVNQRNTFYGGARVKQQSNLANQNLLQRGDLLSQFQNQLSDVDRQLLEYQLGQEQGLAGARNEAYQRALDEALQYGYGATASTGPVSDPVTPDYGTPEYNALIDEIVGSVPASEQIDVRQRRPEDQYRYAGAGRAIA